MTNLLGNLGDGGTIRAFGAVAAVASLGAIALGGEAERYAQVHRPALPVTSIPAPNNAASWELRLNVVDYGATGSFEPGGQRELRGLGSCDDISGQH
jgi:hypothetical protein